MKTKTIAPVTFKGSVQDLAELELSLDKSNKSIIEVMKVGTWMHPIFGEVIVDHDRMDQFVRNFDSGIRKALAVDVEHKPTDGAVGWFKRLFVEDNSLFAEIEWTREGVELIDSKKYRFFSPEFVTVWEDPATGIEYRDVLMGGAITNRPFFRELEEIVLSEQGVVSYKFLEGGDNQMTKEEMLAKMKEDAEYSLPEDATDEDKATYEEAKKAFVPEDKKEEKPEDKPEDKPEGESEDKPEDKADEPDVPASKEGEETVEASEKKTYTLSENQYKKMQEAVKAGNRAMNEVRAMKISEEVNSFTYSESNKTGTLLPKTAERVQKFSLRLNDKQRKEFFEIVKSLPKINLFTEVGRTTHMDMSEDGKTGSDLLHARTLKLLGSETYTHEEYREAAYKAEAELVKEGNKF